MDQGLPIDFGLTSTCPQAEMKYHPDSLEVTCDQHVSSPFIDQDYRWKSVATQIPHDAGLTSLRSDGNQTRDGCVRVSNGHNFPRGRTKFQIIHIFSSKYRIVCTNATIWTFCTLAPFYWGCRRDCDLVSTSAGHISVMCICNMRRCQGW